MDQFFSKSTQYKWQGFTIIELIVVIGIIATLAAIVLLAINPNRQFALTRNAQRKHDITQLLESLNQYSTDHGGQYPATIPVAPAVAKDACTAALAACVANTADLQALVPSYIAGLPHDPGGSGNAPGSDADTKYSVQITVGNRVIVSAVNTELGVPNFTVTR